MYTYNNFIPLFAAILASSLTLVGVYITLRSNNSNQIKRMEFEAEEKKRDRIHQIQKDVYMNAITELSNINISIGSFVSKKLDASEIELTMKSFASTMESLQVISDLELSSLARQLSQAYALIFIDLMLELKTIIGLDSDIEINQDFITEEQQEVKFLLKILQENYSEKIANILERSIKKQNELIAKNKDLYDEASNLREVLAKKIMSIINDLQPKINRLKVKLRQEIYGSKNIDLYEQDLSETSKMNIDEVVGKISKGIN